MAAVEMLRGSVKAGMVRGRCEGCAFAGSCGPCRPQTISSPLIVRGESGSGEVLIFKSAKELVALKKLPEGKIYFNPAGGGSGEPPATSEKTCSICGKPASTCPHSEISK